MTCMIFLNCDMKLLKVAVFSMDGGICAPSQEGQTDTIAYDPSLLAVNKKLMRLSVDGRINAKRRSVLFDGSTPVSSESETVLEDPVEETTVGRIKVKKLMSSETRFPRIEEMSHFHYNNVEFPGEIELSISDEVNPDGSTEPSEFFLINVSCSDSKWTIKRSYPDLVGLDKQLHRCIYDRQFSQLHQLEGICDSEIKTIDQTMREIIEDYVQRLDTIAGNNLNCGPILNWFEIDNHGNHLVVMEADDSAINVPAIAAAHVIKRYVAQASDEISLEVGEFVSVIDMPPGEETIWWRGKKGFEVGFFPSSCVDILIDKDLDSKLIQHAMIQRPISKRRGKFISFLRYFFRSRPSKDELMQTGILRERTFGCDLGEHLASSGRDIPLVLEMCTSVIEENGIVDGIYRLSGITSNMQRLRLSFDNEDPPDLRASRYLHDIHCISSLLKTYFRELPNPLLTYELYDKFMAAIRKNDDTERTVAFHHAIQRLPPPHYRTLEYLLRHLEKCASYSKSTNMNEKNLAIVWAPNLLRPNVKEPCGAALLDIRNQAIIMEYLLKNVGIFFDKNLASAAVAFYPETEETPTPAADLGCGKEFILDRTNLEKIGNSPPKLISLTEARTRLKENSKISEPENKPINAERIRLKSRPPSNPTIPVSIPISPGPSLLSLEEAQARSKEKGEALVRRRSVDFNQIQCKSNKENLSDILIKKRSWKGLFSRNKSVSNDLNLYGEEKKAMSLSAFKRRISYDVGGSSGLGTPRSQSSFNLRDLEPCEVNTRPPTGKKGKKKKLEISSPLGIRTSSFVSYVGGMDQLERSSTVPEAEIRQMAKSTKAKRAIKKTVDVTMELNVGTKEKDSDTEFKRTLEVINDDSIEDACLIQSKEGAMDKGDECCEAHIEARSGYDVQPDNANLKELDQLIINCSSTNKNENMLCSPASPVDEKSLRNSMWIEKYDEIARSCSNGSAVSSQNDRTVQAKVASVEDADHCALPRVSEDILPRRRLATEIRNSIMNRGNRELQSKSKYARNLSDDANLRSQSVDLPCTRPLYDKRASFLSDSGVSNATDVDGVLTIDWVPVMQRSLTNASDYKGCVPIRFPLETFQKSESNEQVSVSMRQWTSRPFSSYDNHPQPQNDADVKDPENKTKNRPSIYDNILLVD